MTIAQTHRRHAIHLTADTELPRRDQPHILRIGAFTRPAREFAEVSTAYTLSARDVPSKGGQREKVACVQNDRAWEEDVQAQESAMRSRRLLDLWKAAW